MAERTFRSPGYFEREIEIQSSNSGISGVPAGIAGTAEKGPAFVPVILGNMSQFREVFGKLSSERYGPYAVSVFLKNQTAVSYVRVLGAGSNLTSTDISITEQKGTVKNAGFRLSGSLQHGETRDIGAVQFLVGTHKINQESAKGYPLFHDNDSVSNVSEINLVRGMIFLASGARLEVMNGNEAYPSAGETSNDSAYITSYDGSLNEGTFKIIISSSAGSSFASDEKKAGVRIYTASLSPESPHYISKVLNSNPDNFSLDQHLLYADFPVESEIAKIKIDSTNDTVAVASGSHGTTNSGGDSTLFFREIFGSFNTRYQTAKTTPFISQPYGSTEYDLFHFESLDDGEAGNRRTKISISNLKRSTDKNNPYGTFTVLVRDYYDNDLDPVVLEQYPECNLNPDSFDYVANKIGDRKVYFNFDASAEDEKRVNVSGKRPNVSKHVRIVMNQNVEDKLIPQDSLPFGFRGLPIVKTSDALSDAAAGVLPIGSTGKRLEFKEGTLSNASLKYAVLPPVPFTFKATRNKTSGENFTGDPGILELADSRIYWGIKTGKLASSASLGDSVLSSNAALGDLNPLIDSYSKMLGILKLDALVTGSGADAFHNNKFSLSKVVLNNQSNSAHDLTTAIATEITGTVSSHIREAAYIRNAIINTPNYTVNDGSGYERRLTLGSLVSAESASTFNRFSDFLKFTNIMYGGFDGLNILDKDQRLMNDRATSQETGGKAAGDAYSWINLRSVSSPGAGKNNNSVNAYRTAIKILTDELNSGINILTLPGIKDSSITDYAAEKTKEYSKALYLMDIPSYTADNVRRYDNNSKLPSVRKTIAQFDARVIDNNYVATYFPDIIKEFPKEDGGVVTVPSSIAALEALSYNDSVSFPWFAPAGFNRGALTNILNTECRLNTEDRNLLYESRINPIGNFNLSDFVIFGQKTLQQSKSALDRVNVRRMLLEVKRIISEIAVNFIFEQNNKKTRDAFVATISPKLSTIQSQQGIENFEIILNESNNTQLDIEQNKMNCRIVLVPTRAVEFIAIDFIITNSGVSFT